MQNHLSSKGAQSTFLCRHHKFTWRVECSNELKSINSPFFFPRPTNHVTWLCENLISCFWILWENLVQNVVVRACERGRGNCSERVRMFCLYLWENFLNFFKNSEREKKFSQITKTKNSSSSSTYITKQRAEKKVYAINFSLLLSVLYSGKI